MRNFVYNIFVGVAYVLGLFFFVIRGALHEEWVIFVLALGLFIFFLGILINK